MNCVTITEKYDWLDKNTNEQIKKYPEIEKFFKNLDMSTKNFVRSLTEENVEAAKEMKKIFDELLIKCGDSPLDYPKSIRKYFCSLECEWKKLQEVFDWKENNDSRKVIMSDNQNQSRNSDTHEIIKINSLNQLININDDSSINYQTKNVYFAVHGNKMIPFEAENLLDVIKYDFIEELSDPLKPQSLLIDYQKNLPNFWKNLKPNSIVTNFRCLSNLAKQICTECFGGEWKMELSYKDGIYYLQESPSHSLGRIIMDAMMKNHLMSGSITLEAKNSSSSRNNLSMAELIAVAESDCVADDGAEDSHNCHHFMKEDKLLTHAKKHIMENTNSKNIDVMKSTKKKFYQYCMHETKGELNYPFYFVTKINFDAEEILNLSNSNTVEKTNILKPLKVVSHLNKHHVYQAALECYFAGIEKVKMPLPKPHDVTTLDGLKTFSRHSIESGIEEMGKQLEKLIKEYEIFKHENVKMEISKEHGCGLLEYKAAKS